MLLHLKSASFSSDEAVVVSLPVVSIKGYW